VSNSALTAAVFTNLYKMFHFETSRSVFGENLLNMPRSLLVYIVMAINKSIFVD